MKPIDSIRAGTEKLFRQDSVPGHDIEHVLRVVRLAEKIGRAEGADADTVLAAAWLHDIGRPHEHRDPSVCHAKKSMELAGPILEKSGFPRDKIPAVLEAIGSHRFSSGKIPATLEGKVLQDADRIDVLGAVGIIRVFMHNGAHGSDAYHTEDPFCKKRETQEGYAVDHFYRKVLKLKETLHTKTAREMAGKREDFVRAFLAQLEKELGGKA